MTPASARRRDQRPEAWVVGACAGAAVLLLATVAAPFTSAAGDDALAAASSSTVSPSRAGADPASVSSPEFAPIASPPPAADTSAPASADGGGGSGTNSPAPTGSASPVASAWTPARVAPRRVEIPAVGIASDLVDLGLNDDGSLEVPEDYDAAGWYAAGPYPGDADAPPAVVVGHVDSTRGPAVFYRLRELRPGQEVHVRRTDDSVLVFRVTDTTQYPKSSLPTDEVYATRADAELVLITCSGAFDPVARSYLDNFVVTATLDEQATRTT